MRIPFVEVEGQIFLDHIQFSLRRLPIRGHHNAQQLRHAFEERVVLGATCTSSIVAEYARCSFFIVSWDAFQHEEDDKKQYE
jgi:hypothetical protein